MISECANTIENKTTDSKSANVKKSAWDAIEEAFKSNPNVKKCSKEQLYDKWRNLKVVMILHLNLMYCITEFSITSI
uniref:Regulatory protein zeste n=1 Tax=Romanomermis culicivorax TaxID=13658 RepID=A0A915HXK0_ROMCU